MNFKTLSKSATPQIRYAFAALIYAALLLIVLEYYFYPPRLEALLTDSRFYLVAPSLKAGVIWSLGCFVGYLLIPFLIVKLWHREPVLSIGANARGFFSHIKIYLGLFLLMTPLIFTVSHMESFLQSYPFIQSARQTLGDYFVWQAFYILQFISLEFFFRGYLLFTLEKAMGPLLAIAVMVVPYAMIHFHKPMLEAIGAIVAGVVLGYLSLKYRSWAGGALVHSLVGVTMDTLSCYKSGLFE